MKSEHFGHRNVFVSMFMPLFWQKNFFNRLDVHRLLLEIKDGGMLLSCVPSCDLCSAGWLIEALMESVWKRNHKCRAVSFRSDVPSKLMAWKFTPNVGVTSQSRHVRGRRIPCDLFRTLLRSPRQFQPGVAGANESHYTVLQAQKEEGRLKFYLINWLGGFTQ